MCSSNKPHNNNWGNLLMTASKIQQGNYNTTNSWQRSRCGNSPWPEHLVFHGDSAPVGMYLIRELMEQNRTKILSAQKAWIIGVTSTKGSNKFGTGGRSTMLAFGRTAAHAYRMTFLEAAGVDPNNWPGSGESGYKNEDKLQFEQLIGNKFVLADSFEQGRKYWAEFDKMFPHYLIERHLEEKVPSLNNIMYIFGNNMREVLEIIVNVSAELSPPCSVNSNVCVTIVRRELCVDGAEGPWLDALSMISVAGCCPMAKQYDTALSLRSNSKSCDQMNCSLNIPYTMLPHSPDDVRDQQCDCNTMLETCNKYEQQISCGQTELHCVRPMERVTKLCSALSQNITKIDGRPVLQLGHSNSKIIQSRSENGRHREEWHRDDHHKDDQYYYGPAAIKENFDKCVEKHRMSEEYVDGTILRGCAAKAFYDERKKQGNHDEHGKFSERESKSSLKNSQKEGYYLELLSKTCTERCCSPGTLVKFCPESCCQPDPCSYQNNMSSDQCVSQNNVCQDPCQPKKFSIVSRKTRYDSCCPTSQGSRNGSCCPEPNCCCTECKIQCVAICSSSRLAPKKSQDRLACDEDRCYGKKKMSCDGLNKHNGLTSRDTEKCFDSCLEKLTKLKIKPSDSTDDRERPRHRSRSEHNISQKHVDEEGFSRCFCDCARPKATPIDGSRERRDRASERYRKSSERDYPMDRREASRYKNAADERIDHVRKRSRESWDDRERRHERKDSYDHQRDGHLARERDQRMRQEAERSSTKSDPVSKRDVKYEGEKYKSAIIPMIGGFETSGADMRVPKPQRSAVRETEKSSRDSRELEKTRELSRHEHNKTARMERTNADLLDRPERPRYDRYASEPLPKQRRSTDTLDVRHLRREENRGVAHSGTNTTLKVKSTHGTQVRMDDRG